MKRFGKNILAVGLVTVLITAALSFSAQGASGDTSNSSARFLKGTLGGSSGTLDAVAELGGVNATNAGSATADTSTSPLDLTALSLIPIDIPGGVTLPLGELIQLGAVNQYAQASDNGVSRSGTGAISDSGAVDTTGGGEFPSNATLDLSAGPLAPLTALADVELELGAVTAVAALDAGNADPSTLATTCSELDAPEHCRDYNIAGADLTLTVPALQTLSSTLDTVTGSALGDLDSIGLGTVCDVIGDLPLLGPVVELACNLLPENALNLEFPSINELLAAVTGVVGTESVSINVDTGVVTLDLAGVLADAGLDINNLAPGTDLVPYVVGALNDALLGPDGALTNLSSTVDGLLSTIVDNTSLTIAGLTLSTSQLSSLLDALLTPVLDTLDTALAPVTSGLNGLVDDISGQLLGGNGLGSLLQVLVNVQESPSNGVFSETAVRVNLLGGNAATLDLATAAVGPNAIGDDTDTDADGTVADADGTDADVTDADTTDADVTDADVDGTDVDADSDVDGTDTDTAADSVTDSDSDADTTDADATDADAADADATDADATDAAADANADANAAADADVTSTLPSTGASNLTPFWLLGAALILFGGAVLFTERRRVRQ